MVVHSYLYSFHFDVNSSFKLYKNKHQRYKRGLCFFALGLN